MKVNTKYLGLLDSVIVCVIETDIVKMPSGRLTVNEDTKKFVFNKVKYQFLAAICGKF